MKLEKFYSLRNDFVILGLTGRVGSGCSEIATKLSKPNYINTIQYNKKENLINPEDIKFDICYNYLKSNEYKKFRVIEYKNVLLFALIYEANRTENPINYIINTISQYGDGYKYGDNDNDIYKNRFGKIDDSKFIKTIKDYLNENLINITQDLDKTIPSIIEWLKKVNDEKFAKLYTVKFNYFAKEFYEIMNTYNITKRTRFLHDIANNLREVGCCYNVNPIKKSDNLEYIYTVAEIINRIIKLIRINNNGKAKVIIDALKNSLELMYFKEKYSGFYMIAVNKKEDERKEYVCNKIYEKYGKNEESKKHINEILYLDDGEYDGEDVNKGIFSSPDIENCIQKSDYHIFHSITSDINDKKEKIRNLDYQLVKLLSLISHPGIVTPTPVERTMQIAYNAKFNSGCISRQVGAVVTDKHYSVKSIGWNDVPQHQMSCKLRDIRDFVSDNHSNYYSEYELKGGNFVSNGQNKTFKELVKLDFEKANMKNLNGLNCPYCFKSFENAYEDEKNQVHTRSLHAEENAMLQIAKYGGQGLKGGYLFSTASPCELCSKKAFQLGIEKIYYIDPYPGIARNHILKNGIKKDFNPELLMFQGAVGRAFHKLYEPFISYKDELTILTGLKPTILKKEDKNK